MSTMNGLQKKFYRLIQASGVFDPTFYNAHSPDVGDIGMDPLEHYIVAGEAEGRAPSAFFEPAWYRKQSPKLGSDLCLLAHYLTVGDADGLQPMVGFDPEHVRSQIPERKEPALVAFLMARSFGRLINPNRFFDYQWYLQSNPDVAAAPVDAYYHFVYVGADEGRLPSEGFSWYYLKERFNLSGSNSKVFRQLMYRWRLFDLDATEGEPSVAILQDNVRANHRPAGEFEAHASPPPAHSRRRCDVYAFYLTQYHRIPENDAWWGEGFTEWHNVVRGLPRFAGHYQPRIPAALGFYDLADPKIMQQQVALAKQAGLAGFAFYYYNFGGKRLLERPLERYLSDPSLDLGYFLIWANETWSRRWDGSEAEILLEQTYPEGLVGELATDLVRHFADPRYRRIDGKPLFVIYRAGALPQPTQWIAELRAALQSRGVDPALYMAQTFEDLDPRTFGLDGALEFPPHKHSRTMELAIPARVFVANPALRVWEYDAFLAEARDEPPTEFPLIRTCFPSWDNDSRRQGASSIVHGSTPAKFREWLELLVDAAEAIPDQPDIACINAWNEWGEGAYLEPDRHYGYAYLNTVQAVLHPPRKTAYGPILLVGHDAFPAGAQRLLLNIGRTLKQSFGIEVAFLLLRGDVGYDALLPQYRAVADTYVVENDLAAVLSNLAQRGFRYALVNSTASASALGAISVAGMAQILLVHELKEMLRTLRAEPHIRAAAEEVRRFIAPTEQISGLLQEAAIPQQRIAVRPQGQYHLIGEVDRAIAKGELLADDRGRKVVIGVGYADLRKGADLFVSTCALAAESGAEMLFVWKGDWDEATLNMLRPLIEPLEQKGWLRLLPNSPEIAPVFGAADVFFLPSREDPLPSVAIEAWSTGLPVAAIRGTGGIADLIERDPSLGSLSEAPEPAKLLGALHAAIDQGVNPGRTAWATETFDWHRYLRSLLIELYAPPSLDVVIVGHNHATYAGTRLSSVLCQSLPPRSISFHDVGSSEGSAEATQAVCKRWGVPFVRHPSNAGRLNRTWQQLVGASQADYFHIAEGDDGIEPVMLERCVEALEAHPHAAFAFCAVQWIDEQGQFVAEHLEYPGSVIGEAASSSGEVSASALLESGFLVQNPVLSMSSVVWRRDVLAHILETAADEMDQLSFAFDWLLYLRAARAGYSAYFVKEVLCQHRQHGASFAARTDLSRHADEIARIYSLEPAPHAGGRRADYLQTLVAGDI